MKKVLICLTNVTYSNCNTVVLYCASALFIVYFTLSMLGSFLNYKFQLIWPINNKLASQEM